MELKHESLLPYQGFHGTQGICHVRVYEQPGRLPVVIAGALEDAPGTSTMNAIEMVAAAIQANLFPDGREFELVEHFPGSLGGRFGPSFARVRFAHRSIDENPEDATHYAGTLMVIGGDEVHVTLGHPIQGDFRDPSWEPITDIEQLIGREVEVWDEGTYTARAVAGERGQRLRDEVARQTAEADERFLDAIEPDE
jgi:hypothetical protein